MCTFTYLRLLTFTLKSVQSKTVATMRKAKIKQLPWTIKDDRAFSLLQQELPQILVSCFP